MTDILLGKGAGEIFDELKDIALRFLDRTAQTQAQSDYIIASVYVNLKERAKGGDVISAEIVTWMDTEISKLNAIKKAVVSI